MSYHSEPASIEDLMDRVTALAGLRIGDVASSLGIEVPENLRQKKGFVGQLVEMALGAQSGNLAQPDFAELGIELKTLPVDKNNKPMESTYVSVVPMTDRHKQNWDTSIVAAKLKHVLWLPIEADKTIPLAARRFGMGILWRPEDSLWKELQTDYEEFMDRIVLGEVDTITADQGKWIQIRPKAANSSVLTDAIGPEGDRIKTLPRGFYIRPAMTRKILADYLNQPESSS